MLLSFFVDPAQLTRRSTLTCLFFLKQALRGAATKGVIAGEEIAEIDVEVLFGVRVSGEASKDAVSLFPSSQQAHDATV